MFPINLSLNWLAVPAASTLAIYALLSPWNLPLYDQIVFLRPPVDTPDVSAELKELSKLGVEKKEVALRSANGRVIHGWFLQLPGSQRVFLFSHGKGSNIFSKVATARLLLLCGGSVLMYDYQGFGRSDGRASTQTVVDDAVAAYDYLIKEEKRSPHDIIAFGESYGCGVSGQLSERRKLAGVILQSGFSSLMTAGRDRLFWLRYYPDFAFPKSIVMDNVAVFSKPHPPLLIVHGKKDTTINFYHASTLYDRSLPPKRMLAVPDGPHCCFGSADQFHKTVTEFLNDNGI